jgi:AcrR family transcriptional regulator
MGRQAERSDTTVRQLVATARELFTTKGFAQTSTEDIVRAAGVTRGALYHHFDSKLDLFRAVAEEQLRRLAERLAAASDDPDALRRAEAACLAFLEACLDPAIRQVLLIDGEAVLGWDEMRELEHDYTLQLVVAGIEAAMEQGTLRRRPAAPLAHLLFGALCEAAMVIARAEDKDTAIAEVGAEVVALLRALAQT